jgi:hypothetical protein
MAAAAPTINSISPGVTRTDVINEAAGAHVTVLGVDPGIHYI